MPVDLPRFGCSIRLNVKTWESLLLAYPTAGLSHRLVQDKQLELAHAKVYCVVYNTPIVDASVAYLLDY